MKANKVIYVYFEDVLVGTLAKTSSHMVAFEYDDMWIKNGFSISPFSLPLERKVFIPTKSHFNGLFGVFADSLPDAWGNILLNRVLKKNGINPDELNILDRLAIVGASGMGALTYKPEIKIEKQFGDMDLDIISNECKKILNSEYSEELDRLYHLGGTSGGARPKIMTDIDNEPWIIKFPAHMDGLWSGKMEYEYSLCAKECGINMTNTRLFDSKECDGYFGTKRFDREGRKRFHTLTVSAILEVDFNAPVLDYNDLLKLTKILTRDSKEQTENMYRRMCFNVFAHNRDDHAKNFTFSYNAQEDMWELSPAYDLTYSNTYYGEHTTSINGNGKNPSMDDLVAVGTKAGLSRKQCEDIAENIRKRVMDRLGKYLSI